MTRAFKRSIARVLIGVLLFAQMAVAAYACPGMLPSTAGVMVSATSASMGVGITSSADEAGDQANGMTGWDQMDRETANLCAQHCQYGQQTAGHDETPAVPPALATSLIVLEPLPVAPGSWRDHTSLIFPAAASPPHTILHCCFRI